MAVDESSIQAGYAAASRRSPVDRKTLTTALKPYKGLTIASTRGQSDAQLRTRAAQAVIARRKADMEKSSKPKTPTPATIQRLSNGSPLKPMQDPDWVQRKLREWGFANATPPSYALASLEQFQSWLRRAKAFATRPR